MKIPSVAKKNRLSQRRKKVSGTAKNRWHRICTRIDTCLTRCQKFELLPIFLICCFVIVDKEYFLNFLLHISGRDVKMISDKLLNVIVEYIYVYNIFQLKMMTNLNVCLSLQITFIFHLKYGEACLPISTQVLHGCPEHILL